MHGGEYAGTYQEGAEQAQGKGQNRQQYCPALEAAALFRYRQRMDQRSTHQPRHERGVFDRIPEPPAAPAQLVIRPPAPQRDTEGQKRPGRCCPRPRPARPGGIELATQQGGDGEGERYRKAHVAHIQHGRMNNQAKILQQRVEIASIHSGGNQPVKGIGGEQRK